MRQGILFLQGAGETTYDLWDNRLVASLEDTLGSDVDVHYPRLSCAGDLTFSAWKPEVLGELHRVEAGTLIVAHSFGATVLLHVLAENKAFQPGGLFLIAAPFIGEGGWTDEEAENARHLTLGLAESSLYFYHGSDDDIVPMAHLDLYKAVFPLANFRRLTGLDHQLNNDLSDIAHDIAALMSRNRERKL